jgi:hypothetical protein
MRPNEKAVAAARPNTVSTPIGTVPPADGVEKDDGDGSQTPKRVDGAQTTERSARRHTLGS